MTGKILSPRATRYDVRYPTDPGLLFRRILVHGRYRPTTSMRLLKEKEVIDLDWLTRRMRVDSVPIPPITRSCKRMRRPFTGPFAFLRPVKSICKNYFSAFGVPERWIDRERDNAGSCSELRAAALSSSQLVTSSSKRPTEFPPSLIFFGNIPASSSRSIWRTDSPMRLDVTFGLSIDLTLFNCIS